MQDLSLTTTSGNKAKLVSPWLPVVIVILALTAIFSTLLPAEIQQRPTFFGMPLILWCWLASSLLSALLITLAAWKIIRGNSIGEGFDKPTERVNFEAYGAEKAEFTRSK